MMNRRSFLSKALLAIPAIPLAIKSLSSPIQATLKSYTYPCDGKEISGKQYDFYYIGDSSIHTDNNGLDFITLDSGSAMRLGKALKGFDPTKHTKYISGIR